jgi:sugar phosphate isomerase/epimerase
VNRLTLAPTTLPDTGPLEFIEAASQAGFQGLGFRLHKSPAYPNWQNWLGDAALKREVKARLASASQEMIESLSYYLLPDMDLEEYKPSLEYAAELGATYALVIGRDDDWSHQRDSFGQVCDVAHRRDHLRRGVTACLVQPCRDAVFCVSWA